ncbi:MAG TPA: nascent polypeptide-associated complex protein [Candidatus Nanoarchaeia archaeon]|nr:nascent polypeptide-associated complex protein [Candidatus Nanoarchaeia archaeon]
MFPGLNPRKMQQMMKQMGIQQVDIPAMEVIIKTAEKEIVISNPSVAKVNMMGQETFQISGEVHERKKATPSEISPEDIKTVQEQAGVAEATARKALEEHQGDLAEAIVSLTKSE